MSLDLDQWDQIEQLSRYTAAELYSWFRSCSCDILRVLLLSASAAKVDLLSSDSNNVVCMLQYFGRLPPSTQSKLFRLFSKILHHIFGCPSCSNDFLINWLPRNTGNARNSSSLSLIFYINIPGISMCFCLLIYVTRLNFSSVQ